MSRRGNFLELPSYWLGQRPQSLRDLESADTRHLDNELFSDRVDLILDETDSADQPEPESTAANDNRLAEWFEQYKGESRRDEYGTGKHLFNILYERDRAKAPQDFERSMVAFAIAILLESKETPEPLCREIADAVIDLHGKVNIFDVLSPDNIREQLPMVLAHLADDEPADEANEPTPGTDTYTPADDIEAQLAELLELNLPTGVNDKIDNIILMYQKARNGKPNNQGVIADAS